MKCRLPIIINCYIIILQYYYNAIMHFNLIHTKWFPSITLDDSWWISFRDVQVSTTYGSIAQVLDSAM